METISDEAAVDRSIAGPDTFIKFCQVFAGFSHFIEDVVFGYCFLTEFSLGVFHLITIFISLSIAFNVQFASALLLFSSFTFYSCFHFISLFYQTLVVSSWGSLTPWAMAAQSLGLLLQDCL